MKVYCIAASVFLCLTALLSCSTGINPFIDPTVPLLSVDPSSLNFRGNETSKLLTIVNYGGGALSWEIESDTGWIVCPVPSGETETSTVVEICVNQKEIDDSDQVSEGELTIYSNGGNYTVSVYYNPGFTITGFVYGDEVFGPEPLPEASVTVYCDDLILSTMTNQDGWYIIEDVPKAFGYVEVIKEGYISSGIPPGTKLVIPGNNILEYDFFLTPDV